VVGCRSTYTHISGKIRSRETHGNCVEEAKEVFYSKSKSLVKSHSSYSRLAIISSPYFGTVQQTLQIFSPYSSWPPPTSHLLYAIPFPLGELQQSTTQQLPSPSPWRFSSPTPTFLLHAGQQQQSAQPPPPSSSCVQGAGVAQALTRRSPSSSNRRAQAGAASAGGLWTHPRSSPSSSSAAASPGSWLACGLLGLEQGGGRGGSSRCGRAEELDE
jgi:hypothetical protein